MGLPPADILSVSSTSELALLTGGQRPGTLSRVPLAGGAPREVLDSVISAAWSPNGKDLAAVHRVGPRWRLEFPIGKTLYETTSFLFGARFSPKGDLIAAQVVADPSGGVGGGVNVVVVGVDGKQRAELRIPFSGGFVWSRTGEEILLFGGPSRFATEVRAVTLKGRERLLGRFPGAYLIHDIDADGRLLAERVSETLSMVGLGSGQSSERDLTWLDRSSPADVSVDGKSVLFGEGGSVYLRGMDGSPAKRLGDGLPRALSPDGQWALVFREGSPMQAFLLPTGLGEPKKLSIGSIVPYRNSGGSFFADGKRVLIEGAEPGHGYRLYVLDLAGGAPRPVTPEGISLTDGVHTISPDGKFVAAMGPDKRAWIYPIDGASGAEARPIPGLSPGEGPVRWSSDGRTLFFWGFAVDVASGHRRPWKELRVPDPAVETVMFILPGGDGESYVYGYNRYVSELFLIEGLQ
jgi:hypothetical protein